MIINSASALPDNISNPAPDRINEDQNLGQAGIEMTQPTTTERQEMVSSVGVGSTGGWHCRVFIDFQSDILA